MFKKNLAWCLIFASGVAVAAVYYTTVNSSLADIASVNNEIKMNLNPKVAAWRPGDTVIVNSRVESGQATYSYAPLNGVFTLTAVVRDGDSGSGGGSNGGSSGPGSGGGSIGGGDLGSGGSGGTGTNPYDDPSCYSHLPCENTGIGGR